MCILNTSKFPRVLPDSCTSYEKMKQTHKKLNSIEVEKSGLVLCKCDWRFAVHVSPDGIISVAMISKINHLSIFQLIKMERTIYYNFVINTKASSVHIERIYPDYEWRCSV